MNGGNERERRQGGSPGPVLRCEDARLKLMEFLDGSHYDARLSDPRPVCSPVSVTRLHSTGLSNRSRSMRRATPGPTRRTEAKPIASTTRTSRPRRQVGRNGGR